MPLGNRDGYGSELRSRTPRAIGVSSVKAIADAIQRDDTGHAVSRYGDRFDDLRRKLAGWHFSKESLTSREREILYVAEQYVVELDRLTGGYFQ